MSLFGSLFTGVSALSAQSQSMSMISNNIANVNTIGYKRSDAAFSSLVTTEGNGGEYSPGSVLANREQRISQQGALQQTNSTTDLSISGSGFFVVQRTPDGLQEPYYTRAGSFRENNQGYLVNTAGFYLMGWPLDADGNLPAGQAELSSLQPVDVAFLGGLTRPTTTGALALNLNAGEEEVAYPVSGTQTAQYTRGLRVYDSLGTPQDIEFQFIKTTSPTSSATTAVGGTGLTLSTDISALPNVDVGEQLTIETGGLSATITVTAGMTAQDLINAVNTDPDIGAVVFAELEGDQLIIKSRNVNEPLNITNGPVVTGTGFADALGYDDITGNYASQGTTIGGLTGATVLSGLADVDATESFDVTVAGVGTSTFTIGAGTTVQQLIDAINADGTIGGDVTAELIDGSIRITANNPSVAVAVADNNIIGTGAAAALGFQSGVTFNTPTFPATGTNIFPSGGLENVPNSEGWWNMRAVNLATGVVVSSGYMNFNSDGSLNALNDAEGDKKISLTNINWGNGSDFQDIDFGIGSFSQFAGEYNVIFSNQNGAELGLRTGVEIDRNGTVIARFSNGQTANIYKLPLSTFTNANGLSEASGNVYTETSESGSFNLREAGQGGSGLIEGSTLESSNVDLAEEFSKMIITQRAYSAGTKVINTADEMTEELLRLR